MDPAFLHQMLLAKLEEAQLYASLLQNRLSDQQDEDQALPELEPWLRQLDSWNAETAALKSYTLRLPAPANSGKARSDKRKKAPSYRSEFEGVAITRLKVNRRGPLVSAGYEPGKQLLDVEFKSGAVYRYYAVPEELFDELCQNPGKAMSIFSRNIRNSYDFKPLPG